MAEINLCDIVQESLEWCEGAPNFAGMQRRVAYTAVSNILTWPERETTASGAELAAYKDKSSFVLKADKKFHVIDVLPAKSTSTSEPQGELPSASQLNKLSLVHPARGRRRRTRPRISIMSPVCFSYRTWTETGACAAASVGPPR